MTQPYTRPEPTEEELKKISVFCGKLIASRNTARILTTLMGLMRDNVSLLREVNQHRKAQGFEELPVNDLPKI